jgi:methyl-accepting chemotaxis protein
MLDAKGSLVGAWYTGNRLDSIAALGKSIADTVILDRGFIALLKPSGDVVFRGKNVSETQVKELAAKSDGWVVQRQTFPAWGYAVMTAYPTSDVWLRILEPSVAMAAGILGLSAVVVLFQFVLLERLVLRPVRKLAQEMADADLNSLMETGRNDEIGKLADSFNRFVLRLRHTLLQVRAGSAASTAKSNEIRGVSSDAVSLMNDQLRCAEDANAAVSHLSQQIDSTARHTDEALERARSAASEARAGGELVASTVTRIQALARGTEQSAGRIASLSERVQQIGSIVEVIEEIAAGTNLLALNASIEAARAGQQGRGFAVVAGEVRRLAERTAQATQQVSSLVGGIKDETGQAAEDILAACTHAREGAEAIAGLNSRFKQISQLVIEVDGRIEQIAEAAREEASAATALSERVNVVASSARQSASGAEQVVGASGELLGIAKKLENMVERFQMRDLPQDCEELFVGGC